MAKYRVTERVSGLLTKKLVQPTSGARISGLLLWGFLPVFLDVHTGDFLKIGAE